MDATLPRDFHHAREPDACEILGCNTGSAMARHIDHLTDRLSMERARADRLDAECVGLRAEVEALRAAAQRVVDCDFSSAKAFDAAIDGLEVALSGGEG